MPVFPHPATHKIDKMLSFMISTQFIPGETWKEIEGTDGDYFVSDFGRVLSLCNNLARVLKPYNCNGYLCVDICGFDKKIHRLVAIAFIPKPEGKDIVHHIDGNKHNNCVSNLTWATHKENTKAYLESLQRTETDKCQSS